VLLGIVGFAAWRTLGAPGSRQHRYTPVMKQGDV